MSGSEGGGDGYSTIYSYPYLCSAIMQDSLRTMMYSDIIDKEGLGIKRLDGEALWSEQNILRQC